MLVPVRGHTVVVEREGNGRPLVLIHGLGTPSVWSRVREPLSRSYDVHTIHLPGFGASDPTPATCSVREHASIVEDVLEELGLRNAVLAGISYGGQVASVLAASSPGRLGALVVICGSGLMRSYRLLAWNPFFRMACALANAFVLRHERSIRLMNTRLYADPRNQPPKLVKEFHRMMLDDRRRSNWFDCVHNAAAPDEAFASSLSAIRLPTLILWGESDRVIPVRYAGEYSRRIAGSRLRIFAECGHALPLEQPAELCAAVAEFLDELPVRTDDAR